MEDYDIGEKPSRLEHGIVGIISAGVLAAAVYISYEPAEQSQPILVNPPKAKQEMPEIFNLYIAGLEKIADELDKRGIENKDQAFALYLIEAAKLKQNIFGALEENSSSN